MDKYSLVRGSSPFEKNIILGACFW